MGITDEIRRAFESLKMTSAGGNNPVENTFISVNIPDSLDDPAVTADKGNVGEIQKFSSAQFGNVRSLAVNPFGFILTTLLKKIKSGAGILFIAIIALEVAKFLISELFKPGRPFDIRFREQIDKQIIKFLERKEQQELKQGFKSVITTTIGGLRGDSLRDQIGGNFYLQGSIRADIIDPSRISPVNGFAINPQTKSFTLTAQNRNRANRG